MTHLANNFIGDAVHLADVLLESLEVSMVLHQVCNNKTTGQKTSQAHLGERNGGNRTVGFLERSHEMGIA
jgi:hypothetical protein